MRWRQPNAGLARTRCHQSSWVRRSAFLKHEDLIELTPSPRADGLEHSVNAATDYCKQLLVAVIAPRGARQSSAWPRGAKCTAWAHEPLPNTAPGSSCCTSTPHSCSQGQWQVLFVMFSIARGGLLNIFLVFIDFKLSHLWLVSGAVPGAASAILSTSVVATHSVHSQTILNMWNMTLCIPYSLVTFAALPE